MRSDRPPPARPLTGALPAMRVEPYRWRASGSFIAHLFKATTQQHHRALAGTIARFVPKDAVVFDVGAHAGQYVKLFARAAFEGRVYAVEPGSYARSILRVVTWRYRLANVWVLPFALGAGCGLSPLSVPVKRRGSYGFGLSHLGSPEQRWAAVAQELVAMTTLDAVVAALGVDRVDFIKADIEGWEFAFLRGAEDTLRRFRPALLLELSQAHLARAGDRLADVFAFLAARGYAAFTLTHERELAPVRDLCDGDFWFVSGGDRINRGPLTGRAP